MKEIKNFPLKLKLAKLNILKNIDLPKIPILINNDIANFNSKRILSKNNLNNSRKLKTKLKIKQIKIKEDSKESQNLLLNKLRKIRANNLIKNQKSLAQMAKEIAEKNMTHYLSGYYDIFDGKNPFESESQSENYNDMNDINENSFNEKDSERSSTVRNIFKPKKLKKNYSQDFITVRNRVLKDDEKIQQYERLLLKNKLNKVTINVKDKNYEDLLSSYKALSQNKRIYDNIMNNYKGIMITQYSNTIGKLNPIIKIHENNIQQNIKIFPSITKSIEHNNKSDYFDYDELQFIESLNENSGPEIKKHLNEKLFDKSLLFKRNRLYVLKNYYRYPNKNFPGSLSEFSITQDKGESILFGGHNSGKNPKIWKFNSSELSWDVIKSEDNLVYSRYGHTSVLKNGNLYVYGGVYTQFKAFANIEIFNFETKKWTSPIFNTKYIVSLRKNHIACSVWNCMFIQGGIDEEGEYLNDCYLLNYQPLQWKIPSIKKSNVKIPCLAYHSSCLVIPTEFREDPSFTIYKRIPEVKLKTINIKELGLYIFGGKMTKTGSLNKDLYVLKIGGRELEWIKLNTFGVPPPKRYGASMSYYETGNLLIIHGGRHNAKYNFAYNDTYILDLYSLNWMKVDYFDKNKKPAKRFFHQSFVDNNFFYVFGGMNESNYLGSEMFILDLDSHKKCIKNKEEYNLLKIINKSKKGDKSFPPVNDK
jgi:hypothetical protein